MCYREENVAHNVAFLLETYQSENVYNVISSGFPSQWEFTELFGCSEHVQLLHQRDDFRVMQDSHVGIDL